MSHPPPCSFFIFAEMGNFSRVVKRKRRFFVPVQLSRPFKCCYNIGIEGGRKDIEEKVFSEGDNDS